MISSPDVCGPPRECGGMAECLVAETVRVRDGAAAGVPGAKVFRAHRPPRGRHRTLDRPLLPGPPSRKVLRSLTRADLGAIRRICFRTHVCVVDGRFARREQAKGATGRGRRMERRDRFAPQNRPERNPAERPGRGLLARRANRDAKCCAAVRPHGRMRDGPQGRSRLRHAKPSGGGRQAVGASGQLMR